jgi:bla regulator protein BlaR1
LGYTLVSNAEENKDILEGNNEIIERGASTEVNTEERNQTMTWPLTEYYTITSPFGWRIHPLTEKKIFHSGIDIAAPEGSNIISAYDGTVVFAEYHKTYGNLVKIQHDNNIVTLYAHCSKLLVNEGDNVAAGDLIAKVGSTGKSTGEHLHFEIQKDGEPVDPMDGFFETQLSNND